MKICFVITCSYLGSWLEELQHNEAFWAKLVYNAITLPPIIILVLVELACSTGQSERRQ